MAIAGKAEVTAITSAARRLHEEARGHVALARQHQKRARTLHAELEKLQNACVDLGIEVDFDFQGPDHTSPRREK